MQAPNPGSPRALSLGCICPVVDNEHGRGFHHHNNLMSSPCFITNKNCPLHYPDQMEATGLITFITVVAFIAGGAIGAWVAVVTYC